MKTDYEIYAEKYRDQKCKMHLMVYGTNEYKAANQLMNFYYNKMNEAKG
jgi:hypothetical protein